MPIVKLGKKAKDKFAIHISLPSGIIELKDYCKVNGGKMFLSDSDAAYAIMMGMDKFLKDESLVLDVEGKAEVKKPAAPKVVKEAPKAEPIKPVEPKVEKPKEEPKPEPVKEEEKVEEVKEEPKPEPVKEEEKVEEVKEVKPKKKGGKHKK